MNDEIKWCFIAFALIMVVMIVMTVSTTFQSKYDKEIVVACYEAGKLNCESINK